MIDNHGVDLVRNYLLGPAVVERCKFCGTKTTTFGYEITGTGKRGYGFCNARCFLASLVFGKCSQMRS